ncbi:MAG: flagellar export chaperone FliS [Deltaproteobacteria bacterium]|nr:flagellar export chaperone FliS [Deltaproteobacteria bacterium]
MLQAARYQNSAVVTSNRVGIIVMLYEGAINFLDVAVDRIEAHDIPGKGLYIDKASAILSELLCALNRKEGGEIAVSLEKLYNYMIGELTEANRTNDPIPVRTVISLMKELKMGWDEAARQSCADPKATHRTPAIHGEQMSA